MTVDGKRPGERYEDIWREGEEYKQLSAIRREQRRVREAIDRKIADGTLTAAEWQWEIEWRDQQLHSLKEEWGKRQDAINGLCEARAARQRALQAIIRDVRLRKEVEAQMGRYDVMDTLQDVLIWLLELADGQRDKAVEEKEKAETWT